MDTAPIVHVLEQTPAVIDYYLDMFFIVAVTAIWSKFGTIIIWALAVDVLFISIGLIIGSPNRMPPCINRYVGKVTYLLFAAIIFYIFYLTLGPMVIDWIWFLISGALSRPITKVFLRDILGIWDY